MEGDHPNLEELLQVMDCTEEQRVKYVAYKFSREAKRWYTTRNRMNPVEYCYIEGVKPQGLQ